MFASSYAFGKYSFGKPLALASYNRLVASVIELVHFRK